MSLSLSLSLALKVGIVGLMGGVVRGETTKPNTGDQTLGELACYFPYPLPPSQNRDEYTLAIFPSPLSLGAVELQRTPRASLLLFYPAMTTTMTNPSYSAYQSTFGDAPISRTPLRRPPCQNAIRCTRTTRYMHVLALILQASYSASLPLPSFSLLHPHAPTPYPSLRSPRSIALEPGIRKAHSPCSSWSGSRSCRKMVRYGL